MFSFEKRGVVICVLKINYISQSMEGFSKYNICESFDGKKVENCYK